VPQASSLPVRIPRPLARRPHLAAALLRWRNAYRLRRARVRAIAVLGLALLAALLWAPPTGPVLRWLAGSPIIAFAVSACLFGLAAARDQERLRCAAASSWLAALPVRRASILPVVSRAAARLAATILFLALAWAAGRVATEADLRLALLWAAGALAGTVAGSRLGSGAAAGSPGWHYARVHRARARWATAPSLAPLAYWPVAQGRVLSRPSASRVVLFALLAVPAGSTDPGQVGLAVAAACITAFTLLALSTAALRAAGGAARWLAPTTLGLRAFIAALIWRTAAKQAAVLALVVFLACAVDERQALRVGLPLALAYLLISCAAVAAACARACRRVGLGSTGRGS
jgi:hypothetical protein